MAEESIINKVKSEIIEPQDEKVNPDGRLTITKVSPKILSRYLHGPKGSCHDLCKYGMEHAVQAKPWSSTQKRVTKRERKTQVLEEKKTSLAWTKKSGSSSKPSLTSKIEKPKCTVDIKEVAYEKTVTSEKNSQPSEETDVPLKHNYSDLKQAHSEPSPLLVQECSKSQREKETVKNKNPSGSSSRKETESRSKQTKTSLTRNKEKSASPSLPLCSKCNAKKPSSLSSKSAKSLKKVSSLKNNENVEEAKPELASNDNLLDKNLHVIEPGSTNLSEESTPARDATNLSSPSTSSSEVKSLKQTSKKTFKSGVSAPSRKSLRSVAGSKGKINNNMQPKLRRVSQSPSVSSSDSSSNSSLGKQNGATSIRQNGDASKSNKTEQGHQGENVKVGYKIRPKLSTKVGAANKVIATRKLTFRRGKVIELPPQNNNNIPRRLKFRPARILGDDIRRDTYGTRKRTISGNKVGGGEAHAANIKPEKGVAKFQIVEGSKRRSVGRKVGGDRSKMDGSKSGSEKVILRHQNVELEEKKHNPRLYNNVIEETASMLAELRKSKVKALVGAFETVISLDSAREATSAEVSSTC